LSEARAIGREHFARLVSNMFAGAKLGRMGASRALELVEVKGMEHARELVAQGRGIVTLLSHLGNWELLAQVAPLLLGCPCGTVYQSLSNPWIDAAVCRQRAREGMRLFARKEGFFSALDLLRSGGAVGVLADQHAGDSGLWAPFFGRMASTSPLPATMALRTGAAILPVAVYTLPRGRWRIVISPPVRPEVEEVGALTAQLNRVLEGQIRESPADWLWSHNRWKTPRPQFLLGKTKRGMVAEGVTRRFRLVVRSTNWLGDAVMTVPAVKAMRRTRPDLELTVLAPAKIAGLWEAIPEVDRVVALPEGGGIIATARLLRAGGYDAVVVLPNSLRTGLEAWFSGIARRVGYAGHWRRWLLNQVYARPGVGKGAKEHQVHHYLRLAEFVGAPLLSSEQWVNVRERRREPGVWRLAVCPGAEYGPAKRWDPERFAEVMRLVSGREACEWTLVGVAKDAPIGSVIERAVGGVSVQNKIGQTSLGQLIALLQQCDVLLTNDTGTMHLAAMLGVKVVAVFGSTDPVLTGPLGAGHEVLQHAVPCGPCFRRECPLDFGCMRGVSVEEVVAAVLRVLVDRGF
jgi:lipopolysaccharide heptosyltransferase II